MLDMQLPRALVVLMQIHMVVSGGGRLPAQAGMCYQGIEAPEQKRRKTKWPLALDAFQRGSGSGLVPQIKPT